MTEENKTPQEYWQGFPEAPFSDTFKWVDGNGFEHMTTVRGWQFSAMYQTLSKAEAFILESGGRSAGAKPAPAPTQPAAPAPQGDRTPSEANTMQIGKVKVTPEVKDGKSRIRVELFGTGHQYSDMISFYDNSERASAAWASVTGLDFSQAGEYSLECVATYRLSEKKNSKGNPYKNLVDVRPLA